MRIFGYESYGGPEVLGFLDVPRPDPGPGEVLVRVRAVGVNPADIKTRRGARRATVPVTFPMAFGREAAGTVEAVGAGVSHVARGDEVFGAVVEGTGTFGEYALLAGSATALRPATVTAEQAACIPVALGTALDAVDHLALPPGTMLLVTGAGGGVGLAACELAAGGGVRVLGLASPAKEPLVSRTGAMHVASAPGWVDAVRAVAPDGLDGVLDCVGGEVLDVAASLRAPSGSLVTIGDAGRSEEFGASVLVRRRTTEAFERVARLIAEGRLTPHLATVLPFESAAEAVAIVEEGHAAGKVVVTLR